MKHFHIRKPKIKFKKPDIKGFFTKLKNLKKEDIKRHFKERKEQTAHFGETAQQQVCPQDAAGIQVDEPVFPAAPVPPGMCHQLSDRSGFPSLFV